MYNFNVNGVEMSLDLRKLRLYDRGKIYKLGVAPKQINGRVYFKLTNSCNLSCIYCFQKNDAKKCIKPVDITRFEAAVRECLNHRNMDFYLFGGEPFLDNQYDNVLFLLRNSNVPFYVFTNGCYSKRYRDLISRFRDRLTIIITLDGPKEVHDQRRRKEKDGSFDTIISNIDFLEAVHANWICQINIDDGNYNEINALFSFLHSKYSINNINTVLNPVLHCATSKMDIRLLKKYVELDSLYHLKRCVVNCKTARKLSSLLSGQGVDKRRCDIENTYVIDFENQTIYCCPQNSKSVTGTVDYDGLRIEKSACSKMFSYNQKKHKPCKQCEYNQICGRGCFLDENDFTLCKHEVEETISYYFDHAECFLHVAD